MPSPHSTDLAGLTDLDEEQVGRESQSVFQQAQRIRVPTPPFIETRVLATLRERRKRRPGLAFWRLATLGATAMLIAVAGLEWMRRTSPEPLYTAQMDQAMLVNVEIRPLETAEIAYAQIDLPDGVQFYSSSHPELSGQRALTIHWAPGPGHGDARFPFAIKGASPGVKTVRVQFLDSTRKPVLSRSYQIRFLEEARG